MYNTKNSKKISRDNNFNIPQVPPALDISKMIGQKINVGWKVFNEFLTVSIPKSYETENLEKLNPRPIPIKEDSFASLGDSQASLASASLQSQSTREHKLPKLSNLPVKNHTNIKSCPSPKSTTYSRPGSAPPFQNLYAKRKNCILKKEKSLECLKPILISQTDVKSIPNDVDLHSRRNRFFLPASKDDQKYYESESDSKTSIDDSEEFLTELSKCKSSEEFLSVIDQHYTKSNQHLDSSNSDMLNQLISGKEDMIDNKIKLLDMGIKLLKNGKNCMEKTQGSKTRVEAVGHFETLKKENEQLKKENLLLKEQVVRIKLNNCRQICKKISQSTIQPSVGKSQDSNNYDQNTKIFQYLFPKDEKVETNQGERNCDPIATPRIQAIENAVLNLMRAFTDQTAKLQSRLYEQEIRYEETLQKFDYVIERVTSTVNKLAWENNSRKSKSQPCINNNRQNSTLECRKLKDAMADISAKKVQFKGILKSTPEN